MSVILVELRTAQIRAGQLADMPMIRRLAEIARRDREENARYRVYRSEIVGVRRREVTTASGLTFDEARRAADRLNSQSVADRPGESSWTRPMHFVQMEPRSCLVEVPSAYMTDGPEVFSRAAA